MTFIVSSSYRLIVRSSGCLVVWSSGLLALADCFPFPLFFPFEAPRPSPIPPLQLRKSRLDSRTKTSFSIACRELFSPKHLQHRCTGVLTGAFPGVSLAPFIPPTACGSGLVWWGATVTRGCGIVVLGSSRGWSAVVFGAQGRASELQQWERKPEKVQKSRRMRPRTTRTTTDDQKNEPEQRRT